MKNRTQFKNRKLVWTGHMVVSPIPTLASQARWECHGEGNGSMAEMNRT